MDILINNSTYFPDILKHFKNERVYTKDEGKRYDTIINCQKEHMLIDNETVIYNSTWKAHVNKILAKKIISKRTEKIRAELSEFKTNNIIDSWKKINKIRQYYKNYKSIIVTCGPSFNDYAKHVFSLIDSNTILVCIKRTFHILGYADFYILDDPDVEAKAIKTLNIYQYQKPISIGVESKTRKWGYNDINFKNYGSKPRRQTLYDIPKGIDSMSWESLDQEMLIHLAHAMHGVGLPLCIHLGVTNIFIIGWDGQSKDNPQSHFYKNGKKDYSHYGTTAIIDCNKYTHKFIKNRFNVNMFQINTKSLYTHIPQASIEECIECE